MPDSLLNEWFILSLEFYYRNIFQYFCLLLDLKDNPVWLSSSDLQFGFWEHHESLNLNLFVFCFMWNPLSGNLPWWLYPGLYLLILLSGSSHPFIPLKEKKHKQNSFSFYILPTLLTSNVCFAYQAVLQLSADMNWVSDNLTQFWH